MQNDTNLDTVAPMGACSRPSPPNAEDEIARLSAVADEKKREVYFVESLAEARVETISDQAAKISELHRKLGSLGIRVSASLRAAADALKERDIAHMDFADFASTMTGRLQAAENTVVTMIDENVALQAEVTVQGTKFEEQARSQFLLSSNHDRMRRDLLEALRENKRLKKQAVESDLYLKSAEFVGTQTTQCGRCSVIKHTPWRWDADDLYPGSEQWGYICATCFYELCREEIKARDKEIAELKIHLAGRTEEVEIQGSASTNLGDASC